MIESESKCSRTKYVNAASIQIAYRGKVDVMLVYKALEHHDTVSQSSPLKADKSFCQL